jgi:type II secretory pathway component PulF
MLNSGMLLVNGLHAVTHIYRRSLFADELHLLTDAISTGHPWAYGIEQCTFVPKLAKQMLVLSEQTGTLPKALSQLNLYYQQQFQQKVQLLMSILEPCVIIVLGLGILAMAGSLFLPLVQSYQYLL